jgi:hypothetical protein
MEEITEVGDRLLLLDPSVARIGASYNHCILHCHDLNLYYGDFNVKIYLFIVYVYFVSLTTFIIGQITRSYVNNEAQRLWKELLVV